MKSKKHPRPIKRALPFFFSPKRTSDANLKSGSKSCIFSVLYGTLDIEIKG